MMPPIDAQNNGGTEGGKEEKGCGPAGIVYHSTKYSRRCVSTLNYVLHERVVHTWTVHGYQRKAPRHASVGIRVFPHRSRREAPKENFGPVGPSYLATSSGWIQRGMSRGGQGMETPGGVQKRSKRGGLIFGDCFLHF